MQLELQLIQLFLWVCHLYDTCPQLKFQRRGNNHEPVFSDQELVAVYLFGPMQGFRRFLSAKFQPLIRISCRLTDILPKKQKRKFTMQ
jgi:hypothetical protein